MCCFDVLVAVDSFGVVEKNCFEELFVCVQSCFVTRVRVFCDM